MQFGVPCSTGISLSSADTADRVSTIRRDRAAVQGVGRQTVDHLSVGEQIGRVGPESGTRGVALGDLGSLRIRQALEMGPDAAEHEYL